MTIGQKLKSLRVKQGLTQKDLADQLHVTFQTVSKWENDENEPDISTLKELAKLYDCSIDYLLSEDDVEEEKKEEVSPVTKTVIVHQNALHVCNKCHKDIPENEIAIDHVCVRMGGRGRSAEYRDDYYHMTCLAEINKQRLDAQRRAKEAKANKSKKLSFGWGIAAGVVALGLVLGILFGVQYTRETLNPAIIVLLGVLSSYAIFADVYCIISGSFIGDVFLTIASWTIRFPGLIFSWDLGGFVWLIGMKILFAVLGFLLTASLFMLAVGVSAFLAAICFPFILIHNIRTNYDDAL